MNSSTMVESDGQCIPMKEVERQDDVEVDVAVVAFSEDTRPNRHRICCHDSKRIIPWTLFSSCMTLTVVLLVLFLVFKDDHHLSGSKSDVEGVHTNDTPAYSLTSSLCGLRHNVEHPGIDLRVAGGHPTSIDAWPWMTSLRDERGKHFCGAALINERWLLTAAHCLYPSLSPTLTSVTFGDTSLSDPSEHHQVRESVETYLHPNFDPETFVNDIALVRFDPPVSPNVAVSSACLNAGTTEIDDFAKCFVAGWGATSYSDVQSDDLQEGRVPLIPLQNCSDHYGVRHQVTSDMICAVSTDWQVDTCKGDSGGPLMCENNEINGGNTWSVVGVTSFGYGCWNPGDPAPGVYTRVSSYYEDFIKLTVETGTHPYGEGDGRR